MFFLPLIHTPTDTKSKINNKNKKSTTKSTKKINHWNKIVGSVIGDHGSWIGEVIWIGVDGDQ